MDTLPTYLQTLADYYRTTEFKSWGTTLPFAGLHRDEQYCINKYLKNKDCSIVDMGTGGGRIALALSEMGYGPVHGFDIVPEFIEAARINASSRNLDINLSVTNATAIPLPTNGVNTVIYWEKLFSFIVDPDDRKKAITEAFRVLAPGGFLFSSYNQFASRKINYPLSIYVKLLRKITGEKLSDRSLPILLRSGSPSLKLLLPGNPQAYWCHGDEAIFELTNAGFQVVEMYSSYGFKTKTMASYDSLKKGVLYIVAQKPK